MAGPMADGNEEKRKELVELVEFLLELDEIYQNQRSRANWVQFGDHNRAFFFAYVSVGRKHSFIKKLKDDNGIWLEGIDLLNPHIQDQFINQFTSQVVQTDPSLLDKVETKLIDNMNDILMAPFIADDVRKDVFSIGDLKAPAPDGLHVIFFKQYWHILRDQITQEVLFAINSRQIRLNGMIHRLL